MFLLEDNFRNIDCFGLADFIQQHKVDQENLKIIEKVHLY